jgi:hypothetical protein
VEGDRQGLSGRFVVLEALCQHPEGEGLNVGYGLRARLPVAQGAWQGRNLGEPTTIILALELNGEV